MDIRDQIFSNYNALDDFSYGIVSAWIEYRRKQHLDTTDRDLCDWVNEELCPSMTYVLEEILSTVQN